METLRRPDSQRTCGRKNPDRWLGKQNQRIPIAEQCLVVKYLLQRRATVRPCEQVTSLTWRFALCTRLSPGPRGGEQCAAVLACPALRAELAGGPAGRLNRATSVVAPSALLTGRILTPLEPAQQAACVRPRKSTTGARRGLLDDR